MGLPPFPPTLDKVYALGASLKRGEYRTAAAYLSIYKGEAERRGQAWNGVLQRALRDEYFVQGKEDSTDDFESMRMELLIASPGGLFGAYPQRSVQEYTRFYAFGSGAEYAMGAMHAAWETAVSAEELARIGVETAARFDVGTGLPLTLRTIPLEEREVEAGLFAEQIAPRRPPVSTSPAASPAATTPGSAEESTGP